MCSNEAVHTKRRNSLCRKKYWISPFWSGILPAKKLPDQSEQHMALPHLLRINCFVRYCPLRLCVVITAWFPWPTMCGYVRLLQIQIFYMIKYVTCVDRTRSAPRPAELNFLGYFPCLRANAQSPLALLNETHQKDAVPLRGPSAEQWTDVDLIDPCCQHNSFGSTSPDKLWETLNAFPLCLIRRSAMFHCWFCVVMFLFILMWLNRY